MAKLHFATALILKIGMQISIRNFVKRDRRQGLRPLSGYRRVYTCNHIFLRFFPKLKLDPLYLMYRYLALDFCRLD